MANEMDDMAIRHDETKMNDGAIRYDTVNTTRLIRHEGTERMSDDCASGVRKEWVMTITDGDGARCFFSYALYVN